MASDKLTLKLVSPEKIVEESQVEMVVVPGMDGDFGVLPHHSMLISALRAGTIAIFENGQVVKRIFVADGFAEVNDKACTILVEQAWDLSTLTVDDLNHQIQDYQDELASKLSEDEKQATLIAMHHMQACLAALQNPVY